MAAGFKDEGWDWTLEKFYHHWFASDDDILGLAEEMGVRHKVVFPRPKTSYWVDGKPVRSEISPSAIFLPLSLMSTLAHGLGRYGHQVRAALAALRARHRRRLDAPLDGRRGL